MMNAFLRVWKKFVTLSLLVLAVAFVATGTPVRADDGWDYVYGDRGPANYSRYQDVELAADGSVLAAGFYSGSFNGLSSPDAYRYFVQHIGTNGVMLWTKEVPTAALATQTVPAAPDLVIDGLGNAIFRVNSGWWSYTQSGEQIATTTVGFEQPTGFAATEIVPALDGGAVIAISPTGPSGSYVLQHRANDLSLQWSFDLTGLVDQPTGCGFCAAPSVLGVSDGSYWVVGQKNKVLATQQNALSMVHLSSTGTKITSILHFGLMPAVMNGRNPILAATDNFIWITVQTGTAMVTPLPVMSFATSDGHALGQVASKLPPDEIMTSQGLVTCGNLDISTEYPLNFEMPPFPPEIAKRSVLVNGTRLVVAARCSGVIAGGAFNQSKYAVMLLSYSINNPLGGGYALTASREMASAATIYSMDADQAGNAVVVGSTTSGVVYSGPIERAPTRTEVAGNEQAVATRNPLGNLNAVREFDGLTPVRLFDTRVTEPQGAVVIEKGKIGGAKILTVRVGGKVGVPSNGAGAVVLNVTVIDPDGSGYLTVFPCGTPPNASNLNFAAGQTVANAVIAPLSASGEVCFASNVQTQVLADVSGWFRAGLGFSALPPTRVFDTRPDQPQGAVVVEQHAYGAGSELRVKLKGAAGVPADNVGAVSLNVTAVSPAAAGYVTVYPCGERPNASNLNVLPGQTVPNAVIAPLSPAGEVCLYSSVSTHLVADVNGWFATGSTFHAVAPARDVDTRTTEPQGAVVVTKRKYGPTSVLQVTLTGVGGVPATGVGAVALNVTVADPDGAGYLTAYPCGDRPLASNVNYTAGQTVPNAVLVPVSPTGQVCFYSNVTADILVDVNGWVSG